MTQYVKIIVSGHVVEKWTYERMPVPNVKRTTETDECQIEWDAEDTKGTRQYDNGRRARWNFIRMVNMNFTEHSKFVTLTFADNVTDLDTAHKEFDKFMKRMRRRYGGFKYAAVVEFQKRGAVHYHVISDLPYIPKKDLSQVWRQGFVRINDIEHVDNVGAYLSKYMTKEAYDPRLAGRKLYFTSQHLERPVVFKGTEADVITELYKLGKIKTVFESSYLSEHHGNIHYKQFNLKRVYIPEEPALIF